MLQATVVTAGTRDGFGSAAADLTELLAVPGDGVGQVDDVEDLGAAEAGDLHSTHLPNLGHPVTPRPEYRSPAHTAVHARWWPPGRRPCGVRVVVDRAAQAAGCRGPTPSRHHRRPGRTPGGAR